MPRKALNSADIMLSSSVITDVKADYVWHQHDVLLNETHPLLSHIFVPALMPINRPRMGIFLEYIWI